MSRPRRFRGLLAPVIAATFAATAIGAAVAADPKVELRPHDHVCIVGNTLADRMQHDGWLEARLYARFPKHDLTIRNLGFSADELNIRLRSADFGSPDQWLTRCGADVVLACFGYNESFAGKDGLAAFKKDLDAFVKHTNGRKYDGENPARVVLVTPIAHEDIKDKNLPDGKVNNERIQLYSKAMEEVAAANGVPCLSLFDATTKAYATAKTPLTINGIHLTGEGNRVVSEIVDNLAFGPGAPMDAAEFERIRKAVVEKNHYWFNRYRTVDGYSMYGGRADLAFVGGQTNRVVMDRELEVLDRMTANRDEAIWAVAKGGKAVAISDDNTPPFIPVQTNKPGTGPDGTHTFLGGEESIAQMTVAKGLKVNLFASEETFPELINPVQMSFDGKGRLWVATWPTYPHWKPKEPMNDQILILEDTNGDGKADKKTVFAEGLHCVTGFEFANGGVIAAQAPDLVFLKDTDGDDRADIKERILSGIDSADTHHTSNSFQVDPGGAIYFQEGTFHHSQIETPWGPPVRLVNAGIFRYEPKSQKIDVYVSYPFANPHGHVFDHWGQDIVTDGTMSDPYHGTLFSGHLDYPAKHNRAPKVYQPRTRPCPGVEFLSSRHFPEEYRDSLVVGNVIGFQGLLRYKVEDQGSTLTAHEVEPILSSRDPNFRPSDLEVGPDGALYFLDWQNPIIGHMQHNLRDPSRDRVHGRIYRVSAEGRAPLKAHKIAGASVEELVALLKEPEDRVRYRVRAELGSRPAAEVIPVVKAWADKLDRSDADYAHNLLEALWVHQGQNAVDADLLRRVLKLDDFRARAAAVRVLCYWRDRMPDALDMLKTLAADPYPRVRLEAVRAASFFPTAEAIEVPLISAEHPSDEGLDYTRGETLRALEPFWKKAIAEGRPIKISSDAGARYLLGQLGNDDLLKLPRSRAIDLELLLRAGVREEVRRDALADLARRDGKPEIGLLIDTITTYDQSKGVRDDAAAYDLGRMLMAYPPEALTKARGDLVTLATKSTRPVARQVGLLALIAADGKVDSAWSLASGTILGLRDLLDAMPVIRDPSSREALYPKVLPLLDGPPAGLAAEAKASKGTVGRFVRIELKGKARTLTLAEVEVIGEGRNLARQGKARQKNTSNGGVASRAIDGNKSNLYSTGGQTHSEEDTADPWWELDLGGEYPIDAVAVYNRKDGDLGQRLDRFTLVVMDGRRNVVFEKASLPAPASQTTIALGGGVKVDTLRRAAMNALTYVRGHEAETFKALARFLPDDAERPAAVRAILRIPTTYWPADGAGLRMETLAASVRKLPVAERTSSAAVDALQMAEGLASLLPPDQARMARKELGDLGVRVLRLGAVPDQMLFDKDRLAASAGKPVEIVFENNDIMPHNVAVTLPGALQEIGELAEATATQPGALERNYIPPSSKIVVHSRLLAPRESERVAFTAPSKPGIYPYVCTYPGHWRRMYGAFYVVADLDAYLSDPEGYLSANPLPIADELLKFNRPRKEWTFDDLASSVESADHGRSFANGKQLFRVASCVSCHQMGGEGAAIGPDLTRLDPPMKTADLLRHIIEPSLKIDDKFQTWSIATKSGKAYTGMILEETPYAVKLIENPLLKADPVVIPKGEIDERAKSPNSIMPKGLLDKLSREEILDLLAYVAGKADPASAAFQGGGVHDHHGGH